MIVDGASQHKAQIVKETVKDLDGPRAEVSASRLPRPERDRGALAPDEARRT